VADSDENIAPQREYPRYQAVFKVTYRDAKLLADYTENLSEGGVFIATDAELKAGDLISFEISFPGLVKPIRLAGQVMWRRGRSSLRSDESAGIGVKLHFAHALEREWLRDLLRKFGDHADPGQAPGAPAVECPPREFVVLLAEDNTSFAQLLTGALSGYRLPGRGCLRVIQVETAEEAWQRVSQQPVDLLIAEWRLCRQEERDLLALLRSRGDVAVQGRIPAIVLGSKSEDQQGALQAGADVFLRRPFPAKGLLQTLLALVAPAT
jgi:uncharacterized protein (TIGR02266 family)